MPSSSYGTSPGIPFRSMFSHRWFTVGWLRYATKSDYIAIVTGMLALAITSSVNPYASKTNADFKTVLLNETTTIDYKVDNLKPYVALTMIYIAIMFVGSYVGRQITQYNHHYLNAIMSKDITYFDTNIPTTMAHKLTAIDPEIGEKLGYFVYVALLLFVNIIVACCRNLTMALCGNLLTLVYLLTYLIYYLYTRSINVKRNRIAAMLQNLVADVFSGVFAVITSANQEKEIEKHDQLVKKHTKLTQKTKLALSCFMGINSFSSGMAIFVVYYIGAIIYYDTGEDYAHLWSVSWLVMSALVFTWCVAPYFPLLLNSLKAIEDVLRIIDEPVPKKSTGSLSSKLVGNLAYNNVSFTYPSRPTISVLSDVNIEIPFGSKVAFVGRSGSGKSTAAMLLTGLRTPTNGRISIDNLSIKTFNSQSLRSFIGFVPQEPAFFTASVSDNLKLGFDVSDDILVDACKTAHAFDFIQKLPAGFDTMLGAGGIRLSGGQKQRLAIARALIRNPKILILDEATSALDAESEAIVMNAVIKASKARTVIIIAHRLATIEKADDIFVFNDGTIAEHGKHDYLIKLNGVYAESVKTQKLNELGENNNAISTKIGFEQEEMIEHEVKPDDIKTTSLLQLFKFSRRQTWIFVFGFVITALTGVTTSPFISLIGDFYSAMDDPRSEGLSKGRTLILKSLGVNVCSGVCVGVGGYLLAVYGLKIAMKLRRQCYANILHQDGYFFDKPANTHGNLAKILSTDPHYFDAAFDLNLALVLGDLFTFFGLNVSAGLKSWQLPLSACIILIVLMVAACVAAMWITTQDQKSAHLSSVAARLLTEGIQNIETIHFHNAENFFIQSHSKTHAEISKLFWRKSLINGVFSSFGILLPMCGSLFVLSLGVPFLKAGMISPNLVATTSDAISCRVIFQAMAYFPVYARSRVALTNLYNLATHNIVMNTTPELPESIQKHVLGRLTFKNVTFAYPNRPNLPIMKKFNLDVSTGSTVALVGASGCGKSTIVQLLAKMYRPSDGTITLDGHTLSGYRNSFAIVSQEPTLFDLTIAENIAYGCPFKPTFKDIQNAAVLANIHEFIQNLPQNYDTIMGVRGTQLSGGQRQRVSLARAFLRNSKILILDEATSALDAKNESIILETLKMTSKKKTCIIVAHRLATVRDADLIVVLEAGNIVESGTHDELVAMKGAYQRLVSNQ